MLARELIAKVSRFVGNLSRTGHVPYRLESRVVEYLGCSIHYQGVQCPVLSSGVEGRRRPFRDHHSSLEGCNLRNPK